MTKTFEVNEDVVNDIQAKDIEAQVSKEVILQLMDMHKLDEDASLFESPLFKAYEKESAEKRMAFERAKDKMATEVIPADVRAKIKSWSLDYYTNILTATL